MVSIYSILGIAGIIIAPGILIYVGRMLRKRSQNRPETQLNTDFGIEELHALLQAGKLTRQEFERARASVLSRRKEAASPSQHHGFEVLEPRDRA